MATANLNIPTSASPSNDIPFTSTANSTLGDPIRDAFNQINERIKEIYGAQDGSNVVQTPFIDGDNIKDDTITHALLEDRYTATGSITTYTGAVSVDWSSATNFIMGSSLTGGIEFDFTNFKTGQVLTIHNLTGSQTITLDSDAATSETFNKVGANNYDGASTNVLIVECIDDDATAVFNYSILTYTSSATP